MMTTSRAVSQPEAPSAWTDNATLPPRVRVLLVEDNPTDAFLLSTILLEVGTTSFELTHATSLTSALALLRNQPFDVVLLDLGLPESFGPETFIKFHRMAPHLPTVVLSGLSDEDVAVDLVNRGAQDYLVKGRTDADLIVRAIRYAIQRKHTEEELRQHNEQLREDLLLAREFQLALLPRVFPTFPKSAPPEHSSLRFYSKYEPSSLVSGDFFDIQRISDTTAGVFICDVMGHGVRAALVAAHIRGLLEKLEPVALSPGRFLEEINRSLSTAIAQTGITLFATALYMVLDIAEGKIHFAAAGQPSPLHVHRSTGQMERLYAGDEPPGAVLGLPGETQYRTIEKPFQVDDVILLYTDGLREISNRAGEDFGLDRLLHAVRSRMRLPTSQLVDGIFAEALKFGQASAFEDDVCIVGVEWNERSLFQIN